MVDTSKIKLVLLDVDGTMTDGGVYVTEEGKQFKKFHARDGMGIKLLQKVGIATGIISHSKSTGMVTTRAEMLSMEHVYVGSRPKLEVLQEWQDKLGLDLSEVAYVGDDVNDLEIMQAVGLSACPADAVQAIKDISGIILTKKGGDGCVRELVDEYLLKD
ncbi:MAG: HAD-IIIA family hydrolase [Bacteroidota bacterium]